MFESSCKTRKVQSEALILQTSEFGETNLYFILFYFFYSVALFFQTPLELKITNWISCLECLQLFSLCSCTYIRWSHLFMDEIRCSHTESVTSFTLNKINNDGAMKMNKYWLRMKPFLISIYNFFFLLW